MRVADGSSLVANGDHLCGHLRGRAREGGNLARYEGIRGSGIPAVTSATRQRSSRSELPRMPMGGRFDGGFRGHAADITEGIGGFIANGLISHRNLARRSLEYVDLDSIKDFVNEIIVKADVIDGLAKELAKSG